MEALGSDVWFRESRKLLPYTIRRILFFLSWIFLTCYATGVVAQNSGNTLSSSAAVRITAAVRGSISVSVESVPLRFDYDPERPQSDHFGIPVLTTWNVNPREMRSVEVIGYFADSSRALVSEDESMVLPASRMMGRMNDSPFQHFDQSNRAGPAGGSLLLFSENIDYTNSRRTRSDLLEMRIDTTGRFDLKKSMYTGVLIIEVRQL